MDFKISIPRELELFLNKPSISILIKGEPGTGKTILALSLLAMIRKPNSFYLSTRVDVNSLKLTYPLVMDKIQSNQIIDASRKIFTLQAGEIPPHFMGYSDKPSFVKQLYQKMLEEEDSLIILDSLEGVQSLLGENIYYELFELQRETGSRLVLVSEYEERKELDYMVDGLILLRRVGSADNFLRELQIIKLRGTCLKLNTYPFTLFGGVFRHFEPFQLPTTSEKRAFQPLPDTESHFSTGSKDLDEVLGGGYRKGSTVLLEIGKNISREAYFQMVVPTALNFLSKGKWIMVVPSLGTSRETVLSALSNFIQEEGLNRITIIEKKWGLEKLYKSGQNLLEEFYYQFEEIFKKIEPESHFATFGLDSLLVEFEGNLAEVLEAILYGVQKKRLLALFIIKYGTNGIDKIANMVDYHLKIEERGGVLIFNSLKPLSAHHVVEVDYTQGYPQLELIPIV
ncbi:MAG: gas vesicle protein GvpD basic region 2 domain-containing protein [Candidatus Freyarchaeota archaeon]